MKYEVRLSKRAVRELGKLDQIMKKRILSRLEELSEDPFPRGAVKLHERDNVHRVRVGDYRVLYEVLTTERLVLVDKIDHRSGVYGP
ncbi:MAG: type II toxin-antitoxin system RelE/ParE family toxin [Nitrososphaerota archaeon]|nr:type II toxin-antitoxin system RelE/ParE family toxin [Nitrososphaerota archaeon]MDG6916050.1 type II toxin-antitoxin system RelE/ParE family toxin [Nitrososphaerota archaeon]MDG6919398.1 type II toxin-antitoxin system RelE/ParE family toxin [Nitrososphaerota archaeon]